MKQTLFFLIYPDTFDGNDYSYLDIHSGSFDDKGKSICNCLINEQKFGFVYW